MKWKLTTTEMEDVEGKRATIEEKLAKKGVREAFEQEGERERERAPLRKNGEVGRWGRRGEEEGSTFVLRRDCLRHR